MKKAKNTLSSLNPLNSQNTQKTLISQIIQIPFINSNFFNFILNLKKYPCSLSSVHYKKL